MVDPCTTKAALEAKKRRRQAEVRFGKVGFVTEAVEVSTLQSPKKTSRNSKMWSWFKKKGGVFDDLMIFLCLFLFVWLVAGVEDD